MEPGAPGWGGEGAGESSRAGSEVWSLWRVCVSGLVGLQQEEGSSGQEDATQRH